MNRIMINVEATTSCDADCVMCPRDAIKNHGAIDLETVKQIALQIDKSKVSEISISGRGEPTLHPKFKDIAKLFSQTGVPTVAVTTATHLNESVLEAFEYLDNIRVSVSSINRGDFQKVHRNLDYDVVWENIQTLAQKFGDKMIIHLTGGHLIFPHLPETVAVLRYMGLSKLNLFPMWNRAGVEESPAQTAQRFELSIQNQIQIPENAFWDVNSKAIIDAFRQITLLNPHYCPIGDNSLSILYNGSILGCFQDFAETSVLGNVIVDDIWKVYNERKLKIGQLPVCGDCNAQKVAMVMLSNKYKINLNDIKQSV